MTATATIDTTPHRVRPVRADRLRVGRLVFDYALNRPIEVLKCSEVFHNGEGAKVRLWFDDGSWLTVAPDDTFDAVIRERTKAA